MVITKKCTKKVELRKHKSGKTKGKMILNPFSAQCAQG